MAFTASTGHGNLPQGNFSPVIYSKKAQIAFRKSSVAQAITNTEYFGEISDYGDTVKIIKEPQLSVRSYERGTQVEAEDLDDQELSLTIDKANYFAFKIDDIEKRHAHVNWESMASDNAGYKLRDNFDSEVLTYMSGQITAANTYGTTGAPTNVTANGSAAGTVSALAVMNRLKTMLDLDNVPMENRWFLADPYFWEIMQDEDSKLMSGDYSMDDSSTLRNGRVTDKTIRGFKCYMSNNVPTGGTGPYNPAADASNYGWVMAGHISSTATAEQINKTEKYRDPDSFADVVRGLHMYGRKVLRTDAIVGAVWNNYTS